MSINTRTQSPEEILKALQSLTVARESCWMWQLGTDKDGYALYRFDRITVRVARSLYKLVSGEPLSSSEHVLHTCDRPSCINPAHLFVGTHQVNMADMVAKGRAFHQQGICNGNAKLTKEMADKIRIESAACTQGRLAARYHISRGAICHILAGRTWN